MQKNQILIALGLTVVIFFTVLTLNINNNSQNAGVNSAKQIPQTSCLNTTICTISGTVSGLAGTLVIVESGVNPYTITANGFYTLPQSFPNNYSYNVTVSSQPTGQVCTVTNGVGTISNFKNVTNVNINCLNFNSNSKLISAGDWHTCAITPTSGLKCWGDGAQGQLGNGTWVASSVPVQVTGMTSGVTSVSAGENITCAIKSGVPKCWGENLAGQIGDGTKGQTQAKNIPTNVLGFTNDAVDISAGFYDTCAVNTAGELKCWGTKYGKNPIVVPGFSSGVTDVSVGMEAICVVQNGAVKCNYGSGNMTFVNIPGLTSGVTSIAAGYQKSCAVQNNGVLCWESNNVSVTYPIVGLSSNVVAVEKPGYNGNRHTCALLNTLEMKCWGDNYNGQLGNGNTTNSTSAVFVKNSTNTGNLLNNLAMATGYQYSCAISNTWSVKCWGSNNFGNLGNGNTITYMLPVSVLNFP